ncbi:DNA alkylation repair protein [Bacillales bacterium AN1005]|uniref:DNA alkylation repair protein n=1 Tax=Niallia taxi TaxID=2499688 RepID=UPI0021A680E4|nr:DNA alkylation repair protein [Niallia taxi]MCT2342703.1 DNA alkylation repair protein [Niallia taxi]
MEPLKNIYDLAFITKLEDVFTQHYPAFDKERFRSSLFETEWEELALKERMRQITLSLAPVLPQDYGQAITILRQCAPSFTGLGGIVFPDFVEQYGLEDWELSIETLAYFTQFSTSEFAVRPFLIKDQSKMLAQMEVWASSENEHIRRLASEGCRPRLPWGLSVPALKKEPAPVLVILEKLKEDESLYVRKSVANNLNDISRINPDLAVKIAESWYGENQKTNWIIKHACRSLLKKGDPRVLQIFGFENNDNLTVSNFRITPERLLIEESIEFSFSLTSELEVPHKVRVEYAIDYVKANGKQSRKVFHLSEMEWKGVMKKVFTKKQSFKDLTTRKHYPGVHRITIIVNGAEKAVLEFDLVQA